MMVMALMQPVCQLASARFQCTDDSLESLVRENTTAGSRYGRLGNGSSSQNMQSCVVTTVSSLRHRGWDPTTALHVAGSSRTRKSHFATGTQCGICILTQPQTFKRCKWLMTHLGANFGRHSLRCPRSRLLWQRPMPARDPSHVALLVANAPPATHGHSSKFSEGH